MPLILTQHSPGESRYLDHEGLIYHYPASYNPVVNRVVVDAGDHRFIYQRPTRSRSRADAGTYFAYGLVSNPYEDVVNKGHFFLDVRDVARFEKPVPLKDSVRGIYYETSSTKAPMLQGRSVRYLDPMVYYAILAAAGAYSPLNAVEAQTTGVFAPTSVPRDDFRELLIVPPGTGYVPKGTSYPDRYEAAALHERARHDHQETLRLARDRVEAVGGVSWYNNNVDMFAKVGEQRFLLEAKSLTRDAVAVDRMRYGIGQLADYAVRYKTELNAATRVLAFGSQLPRDVSWIPQTLQENQIACIVRDGDALIAKNALAEHIPFVKPA